MAINHYDVLRGLGATDAVARITVDTSIPNAWRSGLGLKTEVSMNASAPSFTVDARPVQENQVS